MNKSIFSGFAWNYLGVIFKSVLQILVTSILARLLTPNDYGLVALGLVVIRFGQYFSDMGMGGAVVQKKDISDEDVGASYILSIGFGLLFCLLFFSCSTLISSFFRSEALVPVIKLMSLGFLIIGVNVTSQGLMKRNFKFKQLAIFELISYVVGYGCVGVVMAYNDFGVYSLVGAYLTQALFMAALCFVNQNNPLALPQQVGVYWQLLSFGSKYSVTNFLSFIAANMDYFILGRFFPNSSVGFYNRGKYVVSMPTYNLLISLTKVLFPSYSKYQDDIGALKELYKKSILSMGLVLLPISIGMIPASKQIISVLLGEQWTQSVIILQLCCLFVPIDFLTSIAATLCSSMNRLKTQMVIQSIVIILLLVGMLFAAKSVSVVYVCGVMAAVYWLRFVIYTSVVRRILGMGLRESISLHLPHLTSSLFVFGCIYIVTSSLSQLAVPLLLAIQIFTGALSLYLYLLICPHRNVNQIFRDIPEKYREKMDGFMLTRLLVRRGL